MALEEQYDESYDYGQYGESYDDGSGMIDPNTGLRFLYLNTKHHLESLRLELMVATKGATLISEMKKIIEASPKLTVIGNEISLDLHSLNNKTFQEIVIPGATCCRVTFNS